MPRQRGTLIEVRTDLAHGLPLIMGVEGELRDAVVNIIFNAVDAMPEGGTLTLRTTWAGPLVGLEVRDTGVGMDENTRQRCLEPFFTTKGERGSGLGLAQVYGAMQRHGSDIDIDSSVGQGTALRFSFPATTERAAGTVAPAPLSIAPQQILLIDDDPLVLAAVDDVLERDGHRVQTANGGQKGIEMFTAARDQGASFATVITDLGMPSVDGRAVASAIKALAPETHVVLVTGWGQRLADDNVLPANVDCVLSKPPKRHELRMAIIRPPVKTQRDE